MLWSVFLIIIHWYLNLCFTIARLWHRVTAATRFSVRRPSAAVIRKRMASLDKMPVHLSLVFVEDDLSFIDIARLVAWSTAAGVAYVTIYDYKGVCKQNKEKLLQLCSEERHRLVDANESADTGYIRPNGIVKDPLISDCCNTVESSTRVFVLGPDDGRGRIVDIARQLSKDVAGNKLSVSNITVSRVEGLVQEKYGFPDPDLVLKFGAVDSLLGFLPWQIRLSEIISVPSHVNIYYHQLAEAFIRFSRVQQRFGK